MGGGGDAVNERAVTIFPSEMGSDPLDWKGSALTELTLDDLSQVVIVTLVINQQLSSINPRYDSDRSFSRPHTTHTGEKPVLKRTLIFPFPGG